ncbi:recombinase family protein [Miniphocaeibacter halophilus]|uniref:Recombinase family protein n=1 Tax=Miniphocaeibacter halophilus TaxID=2931922 RepID=A0AC61N2E4_9FIRM|nr:recombinase family protein [Miniphocaeibacter halophilus]QQK09019.1 recombinase family protein [Miniphocaeibacter halophilus]
MNLNKRIAIYCRVSTNEQAEEGYSIDEQERLLIQWCKENGYEIYECYSDRGISGKNIKDRPALNKLLIDAKNKKFDMVVVWQVNRISRKLADLIRIVDILEDFNIYFKSLTENFENNTPTGKMLLHMIATIGEFERDTIAENIKMGMLAKAENGEWCGGRVLGYDIVPVDPNNPKGKTKLVINEDEANIVRLIFKEYANGKGYKAICNKLNRLRYKTKRGNAFGVNSIKDIILNPLYIGKIRYNVLQNWSEKRRRNINPDPIIVDGKHEAIIDIDTWDKVQTINKNRRGKPARIYDGKFALTGVLKCPVCGAGMVMSRTINKLKDGTKKKTDYYVCGNWKNKGTTVCNSNGIRVDIANRCVFKKIESLINKPKIIKDIVENINSEQNANMEPLIERLENVDLKIKNLNNKLDNLFNALEDGFISNEEFKLRKEKYSPSKFELEKEKSKLLKIVSNRKVKEISYKYIQNIIEHFGELLLKSNDIRQQKKLIHLLISEITINKNREIDSINIVINDELLNYLDIKKGASKKDASFLMP